MEGLDLSSFFTTKGEAKMFSVQLSSVADRVYKTGFDLDKILTEELGIQKKEKFIKLMKDNNISPDYNQGLIIFIEKITKLISDIPVITVTVAFEPTYKTLKSMSEWFVINLNKHFVFDIIVDPAIIAGSVINFKGKFIDLSIRPQVEQVITKNIPPVTETNTPGN